MRPLQTITDPTYQPKSHNAVDRFFLKYIKDERDLPFNYLILKIMFTVIPLAVALFFVEGVTWWILGGLFLFFQLYFMGPFILMLHNTSHNTFFKTQHKTGNRLIPWGLCPFMGQSPDTYFSHHIGMHHAENNMEHDDSSTMPYQRDSFLDFLKYYFSFLFTGIFKLVKYFQFREKPKFVKKALVGEVTFWVVAAILAYFNWQTTVLVFVFPMVLVRFLMMSGNWAQHAFIDPDAPADNYKNSITCINVAYNRRCFNDGYHIGHHLRPRLHWTEMPKDFLKNAKKYAENKALVFEGADYHMIWAMLMFKRYDRLASYVVNINNMFRSKEEIKEVLMKRVRRF
ncbi:MAG: fatty acid desaturase [Bacteroidota bacterium]